MAYNYIVLVKQVPDTQRITGKAMRDDGTVNRAALPAIFNPEDLFALEMALEVRQRFGGTVSVISMGPPQAAEVLRQSLYRGADRVVLLTDRRAAASDTLATSYILSLAVRKMGHFDILFCGRQAIDGDTAQVPPQTAEKLGIAQITYAHKIENIAGDTVRVHRTGGEISETVQAKLPLLITVTDEAETPRPPSARLIMKFKKARTRGEIENELKQQTADVDEQALRDAVEKRAGELTRKGLLIDQWNLDDINADLAWCGRDGSPTKVKRIQFVVLKGSGFKLVEPDEQGLSELVHELIEDHTIG
ncbi:MAG: electron transfer flavoprotein subunit beta/FixA family protein [Planctomycetia bacterium]|nr:electron transfer flavoprotein subunit beta/FixA family protein [Planctomycetia bacterium]